MRKLANEELNRKTQEEFKLSSKTPVIIVLDNVRSLNNVGSVFRTADAFLMEAVYLCGITGTPPHREIQKTALGATESVEWIHFNNTLEAVIKLQNMGFKIYAIEQANHSIMLNDFQFKTNEKIAVIFGNEITGVEQSVIDLCNGCIEIPQEGTKHSLNISVAAGIVCWELFRKAKNNS